MEIDKDTVPSKEKQFVQVWSGGPHPPLVVRVHWSIRRSSQGFVWDPRHFSDVEDSLAPMPVSTFGLLLRLTGVIRNRQLTIASVSHRGAFAFSGVMRADDPLGTKSAMPASLLGLL
jgi:hypothetical protein